jgi:hypothetical protein
MGDVLAKPFTHGSSIEHVLVGYLAAGTHDTPASVFVHGYIFFELDRYECIYIRVIRCCGDSGKSKYLG